MAAATVEAMRATRTDNATALSAMKLSAGDATAAGKGVLASSLAERRAVKPATVEASSDAADCDADSVLAFCLAFSDEKLAVNADTPLDAVETGDGETTLEITVKNGGSAWESNPPVARLARDTAILKTVATTRCAGTSLSGPQRIPDCGIIP